MSGDELRALAEAALKGGTHFKDGLSYPYVAAANPTAVLALDERDALRAQVERVRALADADAQARADCAESDDCPCAYKDCYEHGKWHNCTHTPWTAIRDALDGPQ